MCFSVLEAGNPQSRHQHGGSLVRTFLLVHSQCLVPVSSYGGRGKGASGGSYKDIGLIHSSLWPSHLPKVSPPNAITLGFSISTRELRGGDTNPQVIVGGNLCYGHVYEEFWKHRQQTHNSSYLPLAGVKNIGMDTGVGERLPIVFLLIVLMFEQCWYHTDFQNLRDFYFETYMPMVKKKKKSTQFQSLGISPFLGTLSLILLFSVPGLTPPLLCPFPNVISLKLPVLCCGWEKYSQSPVWWGGRSLTFPYTDPHTPHHSLRRQVALSVSQTTLASVVGSSLVLGGF